MAKKPDIEYQRDGDLRSITQSATDEDGRVFHITQEFRMPPPDETIEDLRQQVRSARLSIDALLAINEALTQERDALHFEVRVTASALGCELHQVADCARDLIREAHNDAEAICATMSENRALSAAVNEACDAWVDGLSLRHGDDWAEKFPNIKRRIDELLLAADTHGEPKE